MLPAGLWTEQSAACALPINNYSRQWSFKVRSQFSLVQCVTSTRPSRPAPHPTPLTEMSPRVAVLPTHGSVRVLLYIYGALCLSHSRVPFPSSVVSCVLLLCRAFRQGGGKAEPVVLALGVDGGFRTDEQKYDVVKTHRLVVLKEGSAEGFSVAYPDEVTALDLALLLPCSCLAVCLKLP